MKTKNIHIWKFIILLLLVLPVRPAQAQKNSPLSISEIHTLTETMVNYSPDSTLALLNLASHKIDLLKDKKLASAYRADNNLRMADYWVFEDIKKAKEYLSRSHDYYKSNVNNKRLAEIFCLKAQIIKLEGKVRIEAIEEALPYFDTALTYALLQDNPKTPAFIYYEKAITLQQAERWQESLENAFLDIQYAELSGDSLSMAMSYFLMGRIYNYFGFSDYSEPYIAKAISYGDGMFLLFSVIHSYANILLENGKTEHALENYQLALKICLEKGRLDRAKVIHTSIGQVHLREGNFKLAEEAFFAINELHKVEKSEFPNSLLFSAQMHHYWGDNIATLNSLKKLTENYSSTNFYASEIDIYKGVADLYFQLNLPEKSSLFYKKWGTLKDSLQTYSSRLQLGELEKMYFNERAKNQTITRKNEELKESRSTQATMGVLFITLIVIGVWVTYFIRMKGLKENQKLKFALKTKQLEQLMEVQETERQRIARELHDGIGQSLAALKLQLQFDEAPNAQQVTMERVNALCKEVRTLSHQMMPLVLRENGLKAAIEQLLKSSFTNPEIEADMVTHNVDLRLSEKTEVHLYRITQELISNILKHANATNVGVQLLLRDDTMILIVEDNGIGYVQEDKIEGIGISNIYSRVEALSGRMRIRSSKENGTCVHIAIPYSHQSNKKTA
ncbi:histidine kinase [Owenweeksia hongkongensis DSM 17368]|uniref:histidine kinase n=1 Tax=Owenweeksia hongkongensis (strain DSM 17368 / CIP 108786 / JCM 12287 / NRRL B-23963 / UST20020801) TaxID=926562 RepID=G8R6G3_OWEHD|nr:sensor histidine kinase [Owenweeksia hongkongensis]AEV34426.1 histidine kinase [Owenweeksia hongkongensis DSM 17368]